MTVTLKMTFFSRFNLFKGFGELFLSEPIKNKFQSANYKIFERSKIQSSFLITLKNENKGTL